MATNRLTLICKACDERLRPPGGGVWPEPQPRVALARLPVGGDWTGPRTEQCREDMIAADREAWKYIERMDPAEERAKVAAKYSGPHDDRPLGEQIAAFINRHRWHHDSGGGLDHLALEWECDLPCTPGGSGPED